MFAVLVATKSTGSSSILIIYAVLFAAFYFFYLRPRSKKQKAARTQSRQVDVGQRAQTIGGFVGTVIRKSDDLVTLRSASGVELDFVPSAIARRFDPVVPESTDDEPKDGNASTTEGDDK